jgi:hypothetical protein
VPNIVGNKAVEAAAIEWVMQLERTAGRQPRDTRHQGALRVAIHPFAAPDALSDLESRVLAILDPPLNLDGMPPTPLRARLSELRRLISA